VSIPKEAIKVIQPTEFQPDRTVRYEWLCPQCNTTTYGDAKSDTVFEIRHDPLCVYCRVKNGEFRLSGGTFTRVRKPQ
jgi:hypothetical protein